MFRVAMPTPLTQPSADASVAVLVFSSGTNLYSTSGDRKELGAWNPLAAVEMTTVVARSVFASADEAHVLAHTLARAYTHTHTHTHDAPWQLILFCNRTDSVAYVTFTLALALTLTLTLTGRDSVAQVVPNRLPARWPSDRVQVRRRRQGHVAQPVQRQGDLFVGSVEYM